MNAMTNTMRKFTGGKHSTAVVSISSICKTFDCCFFECRAFWFDIFFACRILTNGDKKYED